MQVGVIDRSVKGKKYIIRELCYKGEEREREIYGRGETKINYNEGVRREKVKGREKKWERAYREREIVFKKKNIWKITYGK